MQSQNFSRTNEFDTPFFFSFNDCSSYKNSPFQLHESNYSSPSSDAAWGTIYSMAIGKYRSFFKVPSGILTTTGLGETNKRAHGRRRGDKEKKRERARESKGKRDQRGEKSLHGKHAITETKPNLKFHHPWWMASTLQLWVFCWEHG